MSYWHGAAGAPAWRPDSSAVGFPTTDSRAVQSARICLRRAPGGACDSAPPPREGLSAIPVSPTDNLSVLLTSHLQRSHEILLARPEQADGTTGGQRERDPRLDVSNGASGLEAIPARAAHLRDCGSGRGYRRA